MHIERFTLATKIDELYIKLCRARGARVEIDAGRVTVYRSRA